MDATMTMTRAQSKRLAGRTRGGHAPGHLREAFEEWVEDGATAETVTCGTAVTPCRAVCASSSTCSVARPTRRRCGTS
jgi:hypothetical protein